MSVLSYNGGSAVAMVGKNCVAIAADRRFGVQMQGISKDVQRVFPMTEKTYIALTGLVTDVQNLADVFRLKVNMYKMREERDIEPQTFARLVGSSLYERRFAPYFINPVIAGLDKNNEPYICNADVLGSVELAEDFVVAGTASDGLYGMCESVWEPDLEPEDLFETISQAVVSAADRDILSGWGAIVHVLTPDKVITRSLKTRMD